jgi:DNA-binding NtrC family response regulator
MERLCARHRLPARRITPAGQRRLLAHPWPGNVRELAHELERAVVFEDAAELDFAHLAARPSEAVADPRDWLHPQFSFPEQGFSLEAAIHRLIQLALQQTGGNVSGAARLLGVSRDYVRYRLEGTRPEGASEPGAEPTS